MKPPSNAGTRWAAIGIACCIGMAVAIASYAVKTSQPQAGAVRFLMGVGILLLPLFAVVLLALVGWMLVSWMLSGRLSMPAVGGIAAALALDLAATVSLEVTVFGGQGFLFPYVYLFSFPGSILGTLAIIVWLRVTRQQIAPFGVFGISAATVLGCAVISHVVVSNTLLRH
jgi:hypothetical protein